MANDINVSFDVQCTYLLSSAESIKLQKVLRRMKRMGIAPVDRDHVILAQEKEIEILQKRLRVFVDDPQHIFHNGPKVLYLCDRRACDKCMPIMPGCRHTSDVRHAKNFELRGDAFKELERADE